MTFVVAPGFQVELGAAEPMISTPVAMPWDEDGSGTVRKIAALHRPWRRRPRAKFPAALSASCPAWGTTRCRSATRAKSSPTCFRFRFNPLRERCIVAG